MTPHDPKTPCHVAALPYPGRGHINPMMNLCKILSSKQPTILVTFIVTEEWHTFIASDPKPDNITFATIPNVIPSEIGRSRNFPGFIEAVNTKMPVPVGSLLDRLEPKVSLLIVDTFLVWGVEVAKERNIPVASLWTMSASVFSTLDHFDLIQENGHFPADLSVQGDEVVDYIPGITTTRLADLPSVFNGDGLKTLPLALEAVSNASKAQYLLSTSTYELEPQAFDTLKAKLPLPLYSIGPCIPYFNLSRPPNENDLNYLNWLDSQPEKSVLYISLGSFLSVSKEQADEIVAGVMGSGVRFLWVARGDGSEVKDGVGDMGMVVNWCDQLRVLCHSSVGGFWSHCGWNSTQEVVYAGLPVLVLPIFSDQFPNGKQIVEDWKMGLRLKNKKKKKKKKKKKEEVTSREEIKEVVLRIMDEKSDEGKEMRRRARLLQESCQRAISKGGSSDYNLDDFIDDISQCSLCRSIV